MGVMNRRYRVPDMAKLTLSAEALAVLPEVADFLEESGKDLKYKADREGFALAAETLRREHAEPTGDYLARVAAGRTRGDAVERVQEFVNAFAEENPRAETVEPAVNMMTASSDLPDLTVADLRGLLAEVRSLRQQG